MDCHFYKIAVLPGTGDSGLQSKLLEMLRPGGSQFEASQKKTTNNKTPAKLYLKNKHRKMGERHGSSVRSLDHNALNTNPRTGEKTKQNTVYFFI